MREIKHRLRKRHGISPDKAVLDKSELVKLLVDAERAAIAKNLKDAGAKIRQEEKKNDAVRDFLMKTAAVVLGLAVVVSYCASQSIAMKTKDRIGRGLARISVLSRRAGRAEFRLFGAILNF